MSTPTPSTEEIAFECVGAVLEGLNELHAKIMAEYRSKLPSSMIDRLDSLLCEFNETIGADEFPYFEHAEGDKTRSFLPQNETQKK
jgi:hypothetical protein